MKMKKRLLGILLSLVLVLGLGLVSGLSLTAYADGGVCPHCGSTDYEQWGDDESWCKYWCNSCGEWFVAPVEEVADDSSRIGSVYHTGDTLPKAFYYDADDDAAVFLKQELAIYELLDCVVDVEVDAFIFPYRTGPYLYFRPYETARATDAVTAVKISSGGGSRVNPYQLTPQYPVSFNANGGSPAPSAQQVWRGDKVTAPAAPTREGCEFAGWFNGNTQWDFNQNSVDYPITLTAHWNVPVTSVSLPDTATLTVDGEAVALTATVEPAEATDKTVKWSTTGGVTLYSDENCTAGNEIGADATSTLIVYAKGITAGDATVTVTSNADSTKTASCNVTVHAHSFTYGAGGATITATCTAEGCTLPESSAGAGDHVATLTIAANGGTYDGVTAYGATITDDNSIQGEAKVQYQKKTDGSYGTATETAPKDAGDYKASITVGGATASVEYTIAQAATSITENPTAGEITYGQTLANSTLTGGTASKEGTFAWKDSTVAPAVADSQTTEYDVVFTPTDGNYGTAECKVKLTVNKADSSVAKAPTARTLIYNGRAQELVIVGMAEGGTMQYALGTATEASEPYTTSIPAKTEAGTYYVWYKVLGDENHTDTEASCLTVNIASFHTVTWKNWDGMVLRTDEVAEGETPAYSGEPPVKPSNTQYDYTFTGWDPEVIAVTADAEYTAVFNATAHEHAYYNSWSWINNNGTMTARLMGYCGCGDTKQIDADTVTAATDGDYTVYNAHKEGYEDGVYRVLKTITVTVPDDVTITVPKGVVNGKVPFGTAVTLASSTEKKWLVDGTVVSQNAKTYKFIAKVDVVITVEEPEGDEGPAFYTTLKKTDTGKARFEAGWTMPDGYSVQSAYFYRIPAENNTVEYDSEQMLAQGKKAAISLRSQYATYGANLSSSTKNYFYTMLAVTYKDKSGAVQTYYSAIRQVSIR